MEVVKHLGNPGVSFFDDPYVANEVVKCVYLHGKTAKSSLYCYVATSFSNLDRKTPSYDEIDVAIDRCLQLGILDQKGKFLSPKQDITLLKHLSHLMEKIVHVYGFTGYAKAPRDVKRLMKEIPKGARARIVFPVKEWDDFVHSDLLITTEKDIGHWLLEDLGAVSETEMTEEQFMHEAYCMFPLLDIVLRQANKYKMPKRNSNSRRPT